MNTGSCYSATKLDRTLIIGGGILGGIVLLCLVVIAYCVRNSILDERKARQANNECELQVTQQRNLLSTSFSNPLAMSSNNQVTTVSNTQLSEFEKGMNVLKNTDELLQRTRQTTQAEDQSSV